MTVFKVLNQLLTAPPEELVSMSYSTVSSVSLVTCKQMFTSYDWSPTKHV